MSKTRSAGNRVLMGTLVTLAVLVAYLLSVPIVQCCAYNYHDGLARARADTIPGEKAIDLADGPFATPYFWTRDHTPLGGPLRRYRAWCVLHFRSDS